MTLDTDLMMSDCEDFLFHCEETGHACPFGSGIRLGDGDFKNKNLKFIILCV